MNLDAVETGRNGTPGGTHEPVDDLFDVKQTHFIRHRIGLTGEGIVLGRSHRTGGDDTAGWIDFRPSHPTAVEDLHNGQGAGGLDFGYNRAPGIYLALGEDPGLPRVPLGTFVVGDDCFRVHHGGSVFGAPDQKIQNVLPRD